MKKEIRYQWRIKWTGRWTTTRHHSTEEHIRKEHPEAKCLEATRVFYMVPETEQEAAEVARQNSKSAFLRQC